VGVALAAGLTGVAALAGLLSGRIGGGGRLPHGPAMLAAGWVVVAAAGLGAAGATAWPA
jgi:leader peptidase (prepilin peptidase)/N-methyltransferase